MAITKRTRFEILRRDDHTCQYCGAKAPEVVLHIDHVMPVALGGDDTPGNLVTACRDCNSGKASIDPGSPLVESMSARAAAYALGMIDQMTRFRASIEQADEYCGQFDEEWNSWASGAGEIFPLPADYELTVHRWYRMGVPFRVIELAVKRAMAMSNLRPGEHARFQYFCGVVWNQVNDLEIDHSLTEATTATHTQKEYDEYGAESFREGYFNHEHTDRNRDILTHHIDGTSSAWIDEYARAS